MAKIEIKKTNKKIGFLSAIFIVGGGTIGTGIFFKNETVLTDNWGSLLMSIISWVIVGVAIISMGIALIEIASNSKHSDLGILHWNKNMNNEFIYKMAKNFMAYCYLPIVYFGLPFYVVMMLQNAYGFKLPWWGLSLIVLAIAMWFIFWTGISSMWGNRLNILITILKFFPILIIIIYGVTSNVNGANTINFLPVPLDPNHANSLIYKQPMLALTPWIGFMASVPSIFFAFDGFYKSASLQTKMKDPEKTPKAMFWGLVMLTVIYIILTIFMLVGSFDGSMSGLAMPGWMSAVLNTLVAVSALGCLNTSAMMTPRVYSDLIADKDIVFTKRFAHLSKDERVKIGVYLTAITVVFQVVVFSLIGAYGFLNLNNYNYGMNNSTSNNPTNNLYSFVDLLLNWTSLLIFVMIVGAIFGGLINRKKHFNTEIKQNKHFVYTAVIATFLISASVVFIVIQQFVDLGIMASNDLFYNSNSSFYQSETATNLIKNSDGIFVNNAGLYHEMHQNLIGNIVKTTVLMFIILATIFGTWGEILVQKQKNLKH